MRIGLTGSIGSGKSAVLAYFAERGLKTASCDAFAHDLLQKDTEVRAMIQERWPINLNQEAVVLRRDIAMIVFKNAAELRWLENLLHPRIRSMCEHFLDFNAQCDCVVEVPLLFEEHWASLFDCTLCVYTEEACALERLMQRGMTREDAQRRLSLQMNPLEKEKMADYVLYNTGSYESLYQQTDAFIERVVHKHGIA